MGVNNKALSDVDPAFWRGRRVFMTGHTGFKGSWLCLWLQQMGAHVTGFALSPPTQPSLFEQARVAEEMQSLTGDVRNAVALRDALVACEPEVVIHMAAQPLVRLSYQEPLLTYATNVMGTAHLLEAVRAASSVKAVVNVTTDKSYENREWAWGYREDEAVGGYDPYSSSKGCSELVTAAYRKSYLAELGVAVASARAGNVIGGGDWAADRLMPDILRAFERSEPVVIRYPGSVRPWQHVLEPLSGYLVLAQRLAGADGQASAEAWNFGPRDEDARSVQWIVERMAVAWGSDALWRVDGTHQPHEALYLKLDISKAAARLGWRPRWRLGAALQEIVGWHRAWLAQEDLKAVCLQQIQKYSHSQSEDTA
jgi:CDP-glucose 4,6-dehydratase